MNQSYKEHLQYIQNFWGNILAKGDNVVDATVGNGHDCLYLSQKVLTTTSGLVFGYDVQLNAIENTTKRLSNNLCASYLSRVQLFQKSHESFDELKAKNIKLITYNLGYLPGSDKSIQTKAETTLLSIKNALLLNPKYISVVCYSGHSLGQLEEEQVFNFLKNIPKNKWSISWKKWINREKFPSVFLMENIAK